MPKYVNFIGLSQKEIEKIRENGKNLEGVDLPPEKDIKNKVLIIGVSRKNNTGNVFFYKPNSRGKGNALVEACKGSKMLDFLTDDEKREVKTRAEHRVNIKKRTFKNPFINDEKKLRGYQVVIPS